MKGILSSFLKKRNQGRKNYSSSRNVTPSNLPRGILSMILGCISIYGILIGSGQLLYGYFFVSFCLYLIVIVSSFYLYKIWK